MELYSGRITAEDFKEVRQCWFVDSMIVDILMHLAALFAVYLVVRDGFHIPSYWGSLSPPVAYGIVALNVLALGIIFFAGARILFFFLYKWKMKSALVNYNELIVGFLFAAFGASGVLAEVFLPTHQAAFLGAISLFLSIFLLGVYILGTVFPDHYIKEMKLRYDGVFLGVSIYFFGLTGAFVIFATALPAYSIFIWILVFYLPFWRNTIGVTAGNHRYATHRAFECGKNFGRALLVAAATARQRDAEWWGTEHLIHHARTEIEAQDPHTPNETFLHAHCFWLYKRYIYPAKIWFAAQFSRRLKDDPLVQEQKKYCTPVAASAFILPMISFGIAGMWSHGEFSVWAGLWDGFKVLMLAMLSFAVSYQVTMSVNSWSHKFGPKYFAGKNTGDSTDPWYLAFFSSGENLQNIHHFMDFIACYWIDRWHPDYTGALLVALERVGRVKWLKWVGLPHGLQTFVSNPKRLKLLKEQIAAYNGSKLKRVTV